MRIAKMTSNPYALKNAVLRRKLENTHPESAEPAHIRYLI